MAVFHIRENKNKKKRKSQNRGKKRKKKKKKKKKKNLSELGSPSPTYSSMSPVLARPSSALVGEHNRAWQLLGGQVLRWRSKGKKRTG